MPRKIVSCPAWLGISEDRLSFIFNVERASIVRVIFEESISGIGADTIALRLNQRNIKPFGSAAWQQSTISNLLTNRAVIGEFQRKVRKNGRRLPEGEIIPNYYPPVIDEALFNRAQEVRKQNFQFRGGKGEIVSNLFAGLIYCAYCGNRMKIENLTASSNRTLAGQYFVCSKAFKERECVAVRWPRQQFEDAFFSFLAHISRLSVPFARESKIILEVANDQIDTDVYKRRSIISTKVKAIVSSIRVATIGHEAVSSPFRTRAANITYVAESRYLLTRFLNGDEFMFYPERGFVPPTFSSG